MDDEGLLRCLFSYCGEVLDILIMNNEQSQQQNELNFGYLQQFLESDNKKYKGKWKAKKKSNYTKVHILQ